MNPDDDPAEPPSIQDRTDTGGPWSAAGPLLALALIGAMLVNACLERRPAAGVAPPAPVTGSVSSPAPGVPR